MRYYAGRDHFNIKLPSILRKHLKCRQDGLSLSFVTWLSPFKARWAVEQVAWLFKREFRYDFVQYLADDDDPLSRAFVFTTKDENRYDEDAVVVLGAGCFRWREWTDAPHGWALQWIWLHPYARNKGHLTSVWPLFKDRFGNFAVEPPLSRAMHGFLKAQSADVDVVDSH